MDLMEGDEVVLEIYSLLNFLIHGFIIWFMMT